MSVRLSQGSQEQGLESAPKPCPHCYAEMMNKEFWY